jgi:peroxiredoxin
VPQSTPVTLIDWAGVLSRGVLGVTFLVAGTAKLASPRAAATAVAAFGAPAFARPLLRLLPPVEVLVAASLAFAATARTGSWAVAVLLTVFIVAMVANLARGRRPACNCFGQIRPTPISALSVLRNVVLLALAVWLIYSGPPPASADLWAGFQSLPGIGRFAALFVAVLLLSGLFLLVAGDSGGPARPDDEPAEAAARPAQRPAPRPSAAAVAGAATAPVSAQTEAAAPVPARHLTGNGLAAGVPAPRFALPDLAGQVHTLEGLLAPGLPVVLIFSSPNCESCQALMPKLPGQAATYGDRVTIALVSRDTVERNLAKLKDPGAMLVLRQRDYEVAEEYDITTSPAGIAVAPDGTIAGPLAWGSLAILDLIRQTATPPDA